jgi:hypothetical protein
VLLGRLRLIVILILLSIRHGATPRYLTLLAVLARCLFSADHVSPNSDTTVM